MYLIRRVDKELIDDLWYRLHSSGGAFLHGPGQSYEGFKEFLTDSVYAIQGEDFTMTFDTTPDPECMRAHGFIYGMAPIRNKDLLRQAFATAIKQSSLRRLDITFPYETKKLHAILKEVGFTEEGRLRSYFNWNDHIYDAAIYSLLSTEV